jgi:NADH-ubiquinone oxidoreductase chain 5
MPYWLKSIPLLFSFLGSLISYWAFQNVSLYIYNLHLSSIGNSIYKYFSNKWYFDNIYNEHLISKCLNFSYNVSFKLLDRGWLEFLGPNGLIKLISYTSRFISRLHTGYVFDTVYVIFVGMISLMNLYHLINLNSYSLMFLYKLVIYYLIGLIYDILEFINYLIGLIYDILEFINYLINIDSLMFLYK